MRILLIILRLTFRIKVGINVSDWIIVITILVYARGIGVIFIYISSLGLAQKFFFSKNYFFSLSRLLLIIIALITIYKIGLQTSSERQFYFYGLRSLLIFFTGYLIMLLFAVVKTRENFKGSLQKIF